MRMRRGWVCGFLGRFGPCLIVRRVGRYGVGERGAYSGGEVFCEE